MLQNNITAWQSMKLHRTFNLLITLLIRQRRNTLCCTLLLRSCRQLPTQIQTPKSTATVESSMLYRQSWIWAKYVPFFPKLKCDILIDIKQHWMSPHFNRDINQWSIFLKFVAPVLLNFKFFLKELLMLGVEGAQWSQHFFCIFLSVIFPLLLLMQFKFPS